MNVCGLHNLNKAYPKDNYSLSKIDKLVDSTAGYKFLNSLDAYFRYYKIPMHPANKENTSFITERGTYCYRTMHFSLKKKGQHIRGWWTKCSKTSRARSWKVMWMTCW